MGKAIAISIALVLIIAITSLADLRSQRISKQVGDLNLKQERDLHRMVRSAAEVMRGLGANRDLNDLDVLSDRSSEAVDQWLRDYAVFTDRNKDGTIITTG